MMLRQLIKLWQKRNSIYSERTPFWNRHKAKNSNGKKPMTLFCHQSIECFSCIRRQQKKWRHGPYEKNAIRGLKIESHLAHTHHLPFRRYRWLYSARILNIAIEHTFILTRQLREKNRAHSGVVISKWWRLKTDGKNARTNPFVMWNVLLVYR